MRRLTAHNAIALPGVLLALSVVSGCAAFLTPERTEPSAISPGAYRAMFYDQGQGVHNRALVLDRLGDDVAFDNADAFRLHDRGTVEAATALGWLDGATVSAYAVRTRDGTLRGYVVVPLDVSFTVREAPDGRRIFLTLEPSQDAHNSELGDNGRAGGGGDR